jgi:hypothetical protein
MIFIEGEFFSWMVIVTALEVVGDATFIRLKVSSQSTKTAKEEAKQWPNDLSSRLNPRNYDFSFRIWKFSL